MKQLCILALGVAAISYSSCRNKYVYHSKYTSVSDSIVMARADSIAKAEGVDRSNDTSKPVNPNNAFLLNVAQKNTQQLDIIRMGANNKGDARMIALAKKMLSVHNKLYSDLNAYAGHIGLTLSSDTLVDLSAANGYDIRQWDSAWVSMIEKGHHELLDLMDTQKNGVTDLELQNIISADMPAIREHLNMLEEQKNRFK